MTHAPEFAVDTTLPVPVPKHKSVVIKDTPQAPENSSAVKRNLFAKVLSFFVRVPCFSPYSCLSLCDIDLNCHFLIFFRDLSLLAHLICLMSPHITDPDAEGIVLEMLEENSEDLVEIPRPANFTLCKRRARKMTSSLMTSFLGVAQESC
jgi:hypothetical protein